MTYNPNIHHRRSIRLKGYDYSTAGAYFITLCTQDRAPLFGEIAGGEMMLNEYGNIALEEWHKTPDIRPNIGLGEFIVMPDHMHGIIIINYSEKGESQSNSKDFKAEFKSPSKNLGAIIRGYKGAVSKRINILRSELGKDISPVRANSDSPQPQSDSPQPQSDSPQPQSDSPQPQSDSPQPQLIKIWQRNYYEHIIQNEQSHQRISEYIKNNPANWEKEQQKITESHHRAAHKMQ
ncbi:MAG: hypothetical protein WDZ35_16245 [Crocinitomicaceae bacterium]